MSGMHRMVDARSMRPTTHHSSPPWMPENAPAPTVMRCGIVAVGRGLWPFSMRTSVIGIQLSFTHTLLHLAAHVNVALCACVLSRRTSEALAGHLTSMVGSGKAGE